MALVSAAAVVGLTSSGDSFLLAALLGLVAADIAVAGVGALVAISLTVRYGTSSLAAAAGAQAVLGPGGLVGDPLSAASAWLGALALAFVGPRGVPILAFGFAAGAVVAGPDVASPTDAAVRIAGALGGLAVAWAAARYVPRRVARWSGAGLAALAVCAAAAGRFLV
ncbi:MAG: hypothetical protein KY395_03465 [Actinobacteria bacterium]|nr:hypothetical protein [Actinomycetota bacterium]